MRVSNTLIPTLKEDPTDSEAISHKLMTRAGLIRKLSSGVYSYLPLGFKALKKAEEIVREEMDKTGAIEVLLPALHPAELWQETGRFSALGQDMITFTDRHNKKVVLGPTHEEVITSLVKNEVSSYKQLPLTIYQIQTKFRDEVRPRFGVIRSKEFIMKDAYSFDTDEQGLDISYKKMYDAYCAIFNRCGLSYIAVEADSGVMGGNESCEFMILAEHGEDIIVHCPHCNYAASLIKAECLNLENKSTDKNMLPLKEVDTPNISSVDSVSNFLKVNAHDLIKTMIYLADNVPIAVLIRGNHDVNVAKLARALKTENLKMADAETIKKVTNGEMGFSGPVGLKDIKIVADFAIENNSNFVAGANIKDKHLVNVNLGRDFNVDIWADVRYFKQGDLCPRCKKDVAIERAIEIGHVFKLGTKYTKALGATFLDENGKKKLIIMGCYGIGVNRIIASAIEQNNDKDGIIWPKEIAPYKVIIMPLNVDNAAVKNTADIIYNELQQLNMEVLYDDRKEHAGVKFKDADLLGIPVQVIIGEKSQAAGNVEIKIRKTKEKLVIKADAVSVELKKLLKGLR